MRERWGGVDALEKRKICASTRNQTPIIGSSSLYLSHYIEQAIQVLVINL
jgi:hypothetical protein